MSDHTIKYNGDTDGFREVMDNWRLLVIEVSKQNDKILKEAVDKCEDQLDTVQMLRES